MPNHHTREVPELSEDQRQELQRWLRRQKTAQALALRARIILESASGASDQAVAAQVRHDARHGGQVAAAVPAQRL